MDGVIINTLKTLPFNQRFQFSPEQNEMKVHLQINTHTYYGEPPLIREVIINKYKGTYNQSCNNMGGYQYLVCLYYIEFHESLLVIYSTVSGQWEIIEDVTINETMATLSISKTTS